MPIDHFEFIKLVIGIFIITVPGYFWSFLFSEHLTHLERFVFGFVIGIGVLISVSFVFNIVFNVNLTQAFMILIFTLYTIPVFIFHGLRVHRFGLPKIDFAPIKNKKFIILAGILVFTAFMAFLPHLSNNYFLPFHVDEWIHWSYSRAVIETGSTTFTNPYTGIGNIANPEIGFHLTTTCIKWLSGCNLLTIFLFMPTFIGIFISLTAFNIGERSKRKFGLESAFLVGFIPTTIRSLGPSFYVAVTLALLLLIFMIWAGQLKKIQGALLMTICIWLMFIIHPPTALAGIIIMLILPVFLTMEKGYKTALLTGVFSALAIISIIVLHYFTETWDYYIERFLQATYGKEYPLGLTEIWVNFEYLGVLTWLLFVIGVYYSICIGKSLKRTLSLSSIVFIIIIGLYGKLNYGIPIIYERTFLYLFILVTLVAGIGLSELRRTIESISKRDIFKKFKQLSKNSGNILVVIVCGSLLVTAVPTHMEIPYYQMIDEKDYGAFIWIENNIGDYRDENHSYEKAAVHPFKASPFSAITGLYIISSTMHPTHGYELHTDVEKFLNEKCVNASFLEKYQLSVIYGYCDNEYLSEVYKNVYIYLGIPPIANFIYSPDNPSVNDTINFTSNFTTPCGRIVTWEWDFGDGTVSHGETIGLEFDGIDDYVEIQDDSSLDISDSITIEMWIKPKIKSQKMVVIGKQYAYHILCSNNRFYFGICNDSGCNGSGYSQTVAPTEKWTHVLGIYNSSLPNGQIQIWIDGIMENSYDFNSDIKNNDRSFRIGGKLSSWENVYFNGNIADIRIYNRALTPDEISHNFNSTDDENIVTNDLVSWWKMKGMGKTAHDSMDNNDGDIFGAKWINRASHKYDQSGIYNVTLTVLNEKGLDYSISKNVTIH